MQHDTIDPSLQNTQNRPQAIDRNGRNGKPGRSVGKRKLEGLFEEERFTSSTAFYNLSISTA